MSIIYSYPIKSTPANDDLILISDSGSDPKFQTKQIKVSSLPGGSASGVSSFNTLTGAVTITAGNNVTFTPSGQNIEISAAGGGGTFSVQNNGGTAVTGIDTLNFNTDIAVVTTSGSSTATVNVSGTTPGGSANNQIQYKTDATFGASANLTFATDTLTVKDNVIIQGDGTTDAGKLKLNCYDNSHHVELIGPDHGGGAASYSVKFPATGPGGNQKILQSDASGVLSWINTPSSGGGGSVDSVNTTDGTYINLTPNSATQGAVTVTADLSAADGTSDTTTRFLSKDNTWDVPSYTTNTDTTYSAGTGLSLVSTTFSLASGAALTNLGGGSGSTFLKKDGTWATPTDNNTNIYTNNGTLAGDRIISMANYDLTLNNNSSERIFKFHESNSKFEIGNSAFGHKGTLRIEGDGSGGRGGLLEIEAGGTSNYHVQVKGPGSMSSSYALELPAAQGGSNTFLKNNGSGVLTWGTAGAGTVTSVGLTMPSVFSVANSPVTGSGTLEVTVTGGSSGQYMNHTGNWSTPTNTNLGNATQTLAANRIINTAGYDLTITNSSSQQLYQFDTSAYKFIAGNSVNGFKGTIRVEGNGDGENGRGGVVEWEAGGGNQVTVKGPETMSSSYDLTLPNAQGAANSVLTNNGSGDLTWSTTNQQTNITGTTSANSSTFANTPFTFDSTNSGSGIGAPLATQVASQYGNKHISFYLSGTASGAINQAGASTVNYATSSDYRLKENVVEMTGSVDRVKQLKPNRFNFIADGPSRTVDGFLAHEVSNVVPEAITGDKDAVDAEGNIIPQGIDQSKIVPLLVGAIKELTARIEALEA